MNFDFIKRLSVPELRALQIRIENETLYRKQTEFEQNQDLKSKQQRDAEILRRVRINKTSTPKIVSKSRQKIKTIKTMKIKVNILNSDIEKFLACCDYGDNVRVIEHKTKLQKTVVSVSVPSYDAVVQLGSDMATIKPEQIAAATKERAAAKAEEAKKEAGK